MSLSAEPTAPLNDAQRALLSEPLNVGHIEVGDFVRSTFMRHVCGIVKSHGVMDFGVLGTKYVYTISLAAGTSEHRTEVLFEDDVELIAPEPERWQRLLKDRAARVAELA